MSDLRLYNKAHAVCSELFLRVAHLCQVVAYRTRHTPCVVSCFLGVAQLCQIFAYRTRYTPCVASCFFESLSYVRASLIEQGTHRVQRVVSSRAVMSDLRLQNNVHTVCSELFLRVAQLCEICPYRTRHTPCCESCFFGSLSYVRSSLIEQGIRRVQRVVCSCCSVMSDLCLQNKAQAVCSELFLRGGSVMSDIRLQNKAHAVCSELFFRSV